MTCKWLMVSFHPLTGVVGPLPKWGLLTTVLTRMILQVFLDGRNQVVIEVVHTPLKPKGDHFKRKGPASLPSTIFQGTCSYLGDGGPRYTVHIIRLSSTFQMPTLKWSRKHQENPQHFLGSLTYHLWKIGIFSIPNCCF